MAKTSTYEDVNIIVLTGALKFIQGVENGRVFFVVENNLPLNNGKVRKSFIPVTAWGRTAESLANTPVGSFISLTGRVASFDKDGRTRLSVSARTVSVGPIRTNTSEPDINMLTISGRLGKDSVAKDTQNSQLTYCSIAVTEREKTNWVFTTLWQRKMHIQKGSFVTAFGALLSQKASDSDEKSEIVFSANSIDINLDGKSNQYNNQQNQPNAQQQYPQNNGQQQYPQGNSQQQYPQGNAQQPYQQNTQQPHQQNYAQQQYPQNGQQQYPQGNAQQQYPQGNQPYQQNGQQPYQQGNAQQQYPQGNAQQPYQQNSQQTYQQNTQQPFAQNTQPYQQNAQQGHMQQNGSNQGVQPININSDDIPF